MLSRLYAGLFLSLAVSLPAAALECSAPTASFDLVQDANGDIVIPVMFGDKPARMGLHFQAMGSAVYAKAAETLYLPITVLDKQDEPVWAGERVTRLIKIPSLTIGKVSAPFKAFVLDRQVEGLDGWLGLNLLTNYDIDIDFPNRKVALFPPNPCQAKQVVYWTEDFETVPLTEHARWNFDFPVQIEGHAIQMGLLPGLSAGVVHLPQAEDVLGLKTTTPGMTQVSAPYLYTYSFKSAKIGGMEMANPTLHVIWASQSGCIADSCGNQMPAGYLSINQFRAMHIYIAYRAKKMYLSAGNAKPAQMPATSTASPAAH